MFLLVAGKNSQIATSPRRITRHHGKGPMDDIGGTIKNLQESKIGARCYRHTFYEAAVHFVPKVPEHELLVEPDDMESESK